jgi:hypothetical protein
MGHALVIVNMHSKFQLEKFPFGSSVHRWENIIKIDAIEILFED